MFNLFKSKKDVIKEKNQEIKKLEFINMINDLTNIKETFVFDDKSFFIGFKLILEDYNCKFGYQNKGSKKHGHVKRKINLQTNEETLELKIEKDENLAGQVYVIIHELTHLINDHTKTKDLTKKQKEVVADTVAIMYVKTYGLYDDLLRSNMAKKWDVSSYSKNYIKNMSFSNKRRDFIIKQILETFNELKIDLNNN